MAQNTQTTLLEIQYPDGRSKDVDLAIKRLRRELCRMGVLFNEFQFSNEQPANARTREALAGGIKEHGIPSDIYVDDGSPDLKKYMVRNARDKLRERDPEFQAQRRADIDAWFGPKKAKL